MSVISKLGEYPSHVIYRGKARKGRAKHTISRPRRLPTRQCTPITRHRINHTRLKPHIARRFPSIEIRTIRHLRHIKLHGTKVRHRAHRHEPEFLARGNGGEASTRSHLEAAHVRAIDVGDAVVGLVVFGLADGLPFFGFFDAADNEFGEAV